VTTDNQQKIPQLHTLYVQDTCTAP